MTVCARCVLPDTYPDIAFDDQGVCNFCREYESVEKRDAGRHFKNEQELIACLQKYRHPAQRYDVLVPVSGGVDSCSALINIVEKFKLRPLVFHNDHGFDNLVATDNVKKLCKLLDVDLLIWQYELGFMRKLFKYFNQAAVKDLSACHVCGNMLYINALEAADRFGIKLLINGYSKGQAAFIQGKEKARQLLAMLIDIVAHDSEFLERLTEKYRFLEKQRHFLSKEDLEAPVDPQKIMVIPFYIFKFYQNDKEELKRICRNRFDWQQMEGSYPSRTTNCEMIWLNTFVDLKKSGYSLYQDEYSTMVRAGDFSREQACLDLAFDPPGGLIERLAQEIDLDLTRIEEIKPENPEKIEAARSSLVEGEKGDFGF